MHFKPRWGHGGWEPHQFLNLCDFFTFCQKNFPPGWVGGSLGSVTSQLSFALLCLCHTCLCLGMPTNMLPHWSKTKHWVKNWLRKYTENTFYPVRKLSFFAGSSLTVLLFVTPDRWHYNEIAKRWEGAGVKQRPFWIFFSSLFSQFKEYGSLLSCVWRCRGGGCFQTKTQDTEVGWLVSQHRHRMHSLEFWDSALPISEYNMSTEFLKKTFTKGSLKLSISAGPNTSHFCLAPQLRKRPLGLTF